MWCDDVSVVQVHDGAATADFTLEGGDGFVAALVAPDGMAPTQGVDVSGGPVLEVSLVDGGLGLDAASSRDSTADWGAPMAPGESVRVRFVAATRTVSVVWRRRGYELAPLPAAWDLARYHFGVELFPGNTIRVTGASTAGARVLPRAGLRVLVD